MTHAYPSLEHAGRGSVVDHKARTPDALQDSIPVHLMESDNYYKDAPSKSAEEHLSTKDDIPAKTYKPKITQTIAEDAVDRKLSETLTRTTLTVLPSTAIHTGALAFEPTSADLPWFSGDTTQLTFLPTATFSASASQSNHDAAPSNVLENKGQRNVARKGARPSTVAIAASAAAVAVLFIVLFIASKIRRRPRKRNCPTPSLPILQDPFTDQAAIGDEESLFGGKERNSGRPETVLWNWTQYSHPSLKKPEPAMACTVEKTVEVDSPISIRRQSRTIDEKRASLGLPGLCGAPSIRQQEHTPVRPSNRASMLSMSVYPGSPVSELPAQGVGIALCGSPLTADGASMLQRSTSKSSQKPKRNRQSIRSSFYDQAPTEIGGATVYGGVQVPSPVPPTPATLTKSRSVQGRARVKAPYAAGTVRASSSVSVGLGLARELNPFEDSQYVLPPLSSAIKTESSREQNTKALASALGLASPPPLSPQPTIYPDDSITRRQSRIAGHQRGPSQMMSPGMDASARLGNLMLSDLASVVSFPSARTLAGDLSTSASKPKVTRKRADDKPPRVPSPPPMPSLAQMALAHTNPEDYTDYRSPTYSIYGLYEPDRKSRAPGEGGY